MLTAGIWKHGDKTRKTSGWRGNKQSCDPAGFKQKLWIAGFNSKKENETLLL